MQLETYISDLLYRYDCVIVPHFGAFLTHRVSAKLNESTHSFYPPKKVLSFNEQLQTNDGLLANYIAEIEKMPYLVAVERIAKQVKSIKSYLVEGETIELNNIGDLILNKEGNINFEPSHNINYLTDAFGLSPFKTNEVTREIHKETVEEVEQVIPIAITPEKRASTGSATALTGLTTRYFKYAAIGLLFLTAGGFVASNYYGKQVDAHNQIAQEEFNVRMDAKVQEATFVIDSPLPAATLQVEKMTGNYHIVAGAFRVEANSDKKVQQLKDKGFKARKIGVNRYGLHEVVYSSHTDRIEALNALKTIKRTHNRDAWLLVKALD